MPNLMTMTNDEIVQHLLALVIAEQNDTFRKAIGLGAIWRGKLLAGRAVSTPGFRALPQQTQDAIIKAVIGFDTFTEDNDPYGEHDFGIVEADGRRVFWKIDLYDTEYRFGADMAEVARDPAQCRRVLTLYLPSEH